MASIPPFSASHSGPFYPEDEEGRVAVLGAAVHRAFKNARREGRDTNSYMLAPTCEYVTERLHAIGERGKLFVTGSVGT